MEASLVDSLVTPLVARLVTRDARAVARALSIVIDEGPAAAELLDRIYDRTGHAYLIGVTGPPGAGKSTLVDRLIGVLRTQDKTVAVLAVDPSSPFTGGAVLGDRIRMQTHSSDPGVFVRSMATRGTLGGLTATTGAASTVLDAAGFDVVILETVGVGQGEVDVASLADLTIVVLVPGTGDDVQALKAGLLEVADIFVVNKGDREGADRLAASIDGMLSLDGASRGDWKTPVLMTTATEGVGIVELAGAVERFRREATTLAGERRRRRASHEIREALVSALFRQVGEASLEAEAEAVEARTLAPHRAAADLLARVLRASAQKSASPDPSSSSLVLDHVGVATRDSAPLVDFLVSTFGAPVGPTEDVPGPHVRVRFVDADASRIELIEPTDESSSISKFLETRGPGLHHLAFRVHDIDGVLASMKSRGIRLIDEAARAGAGGTRIAFIHPTSTGGVLVELVEGESERRAHR